MQVLGTKHIIWDTIMEEANKFRPYLHYILGKELVIQSSRQGMIVAREKLNKKPIEHENNAISFLNSLSKDDLKKANIKEKISILNWARKVINKYHHLDTVQEKVDILAHQVKLFIEMFDSLFNKVFHLFRQEKGVMLTKDEYYEKLIACRHEHLNFVDMNQSRSGRLIIDKLADEFEILFSFKK